ncbi:MAG: DUF1573 domain-containing protein [Flammeovirgaceae bacterium]
MTLIISRMAFMLICFALINTGYAQKKIQFDKTAHEFSKIMEGEQAEATFTFTNTGKEPITLVNVKASCGCTTPSWTKTPVLPGKTGIVKALYNSQGRPGPFNKTITVNTDGEPQYVVLRISGMVEQSLFKYTSGNLKMEKAYIYFGDITIDATANHSLQIKNIGQKALNLFPEKTKIPEHITFKLSKTTLQPDEEATIDMSFDATKIRDWGYSYGSIKLETDDETKPQKRIGFAAKLKENFAAMPEGTKHPTVVYEKTRHDFGNLEQRAQVSTSFKIKNEGEGTLYIRKTKASCGCTVSKPKKNVLEPGEETTLDVTYSTGSRKGKQKKSITVITNDPKKDEIILWIEANILVPETKGSRNK